MTYISYPQLSQAGRLGNQLWQVASTYGMALLANTEPRFPLWDYQPYFNVPNHWFGDMTDSADATTLVPHMDERARPYLQDYALFANYATEVKKAFKLTSHAIKMLMPIWEDYIELLERPYISVHVRRGDNVTHPQGYHPLRTMEYYRDALKLRPDGTVIVFSDDPEWCKENFERETGRHVSLFYEGIPRPREYVDRVKYEMAPVRDWIDLQLMALCDHHILSNSSYAWWGAFLSRDPEPIYPSNTFGWRVSSYTDASLMFPSTWLQLFDATEGGA